MNYVPLSPIQLDAAQALWVKANNAPLQRASYGRLIARVQELVHAIQTAPIAIRATPLEMQAINERLVAVVERWREQEPSFYPVFVVDASKAVPRLDFRLTAVFKAEDPQAVEIQASEDLQALCEGRLDFVMHAVTSPVFVDEAMRKRVSPMTLWRQRYGSEAAI